MDLQQNHAQNPVQKTDQASAGFTQGSIPAPVPPQTQNVVGSSPSDISGQTRSQATVAGTAPRSQAGVSSDAPQIADDVDLIEKEWVNRAKQIVAKTKDDPREQSKELHKYKVDYIKKRYNKDIKVSET
jgi:hypothetical protein